MRALTATTIELSQQKGTFSGAALATDSGVSAFPSTRRQPPRRNLAFSATKLPFLPELNGVFADQLALNSS